MNNKKENLYQIIPKELPSLNTQNSHKFNDVIRSILVDKRSVFLGTKDGKILQIPVNTKKISKENLSFIKVHNDEVNQIRKREEFIVTCSDDSKIIVTNPKTKKKVKEFLGNCDCVNRTIDYKEIIYSFSISNEILSWDFETTKLLQKIKKPETIGTRGTIGSLETIGTIATLEKVTGKIFVGTDCGKVAVIDPETNKLIKVFQAHTLFVEDLDSRDGIVYTAGNGSEYGHIKSWDAKTFKQLSQFEGHKDGTIAIRVKWNYLFSLGPLEKKIKIWDLKTTQLLYFINLNDRCWSFDLNEKYLYVAIRQTLFLIDIENKLETYSSSIDFLQLFKDQKNCDFKILEFPVHKFIIKLRCGKDPEEIKAILENNFEKEQVHFFLEWVYGKKLYSSTYLKGIEKIFDNLEIQDFKKKTLQSDLIKAYSDEDSKDFSIIVKDPEQEEEFEEIKVHKFILFARCKLFQDFFQNITEKSIQRVQDYSGKSVESIKHFIRYLYFNDLKLTGDDDPQLISEELDDALDYYQLDTNCNFQNCLNKIKKKFNLN
ncbi:hypothetical protein M0812_22192 [Anaeramoeba flamelloides]|uniref:BTB domain-containing protein n=1 Tax=Anaeramoeba flamelloides TaxID=1746091 RepID=A0AAV7Z0Q8_9EUKA|nr:hypothetical protein M0812_22192 [Anaeramoeba flamelloides]